MSIDATDRRIVEATQAGLPLTPEPYADLAATLDLIDADSVDRVLSHFLDMAATRVLVFHNAVLDLAFLNKISRRYFNAPVLMPIVDTMMQEESLLRRRDIPIKQGDLRLQACRDRYNLPHFHGHNALLDALATAELLIAHASHRSRNGMLSLGSML